MLAVAVETLFKSDESYDEHLMMKLTVVTIHFLTGRLKTIKTFILLNIVVFFFF